MDQEKIARAVAELGTCLEESFLNDLEAIAGFAGQVVAAFHRSSRLFLAGSGPLATVAELVADRFLHRLAFERPQLPVFALGGDGTLLQSLGRYGMQRQAAARQLRMLAGSDDILLFLSDGSRDEGMPDLLQAARQVGCSIVFLGPLREEPGDELVDRWFAVSSESPARCAEAALFFGQLLCELVEAELFGI
jgi:D-sedoheptulose 7-phosphate isomerase